MDCALRLMVDTVNAYLPALQLKAIASMKTAIVVKLDLLTS